MRRCIRLFCSCWMLCLATLGNALACAICAPADGQNTLVYRLYAADTVALATADAASGIYRLGALLKGRLPTEPIRVGQWLPDGPAPKAGNSVLLLYSAGAREWRGAGALSAGRAGWVRELVALQPATVTTKPDWAARLSFFAADLENAEALVAQTAYEEIAVAPYGAMRALKGQLPLQALRSWLANAAPAQRKPLYLLLLGIAGDATDAQRLITGMPVATDAASMSDLSGALAAVLEMRGAAGADWLEQAYLARADRSAFEVQAAVLALGVHGGDGVRVSRRRVVSAYETLARRNPAMVGYAASDLAAWGHWEFGTYFAQILRSGAPTAFTARYPMVFFLLRSPRAQDRAAVEALRAERLL
ncbi:MAG: hypothetical protein ABIN37_06375 [Burkholderiaceae bacterium]